MIDWLLIAVDSLGISGGYGSVGNLHCCRCAYRAMTLRTDIAIDVRRLREPLAQRCAARRRRLRQ
ncbi:hypothetical protein ACI2IY_17475 [Lysobacter enzymogenes]|uniref:hypothetical protein n=1 Tax=Lysobacter enzymogenes TaxID=69 RepID=UPI00384CA7EA